MRFICFAVSFLASRSKHAKSLGMISVPRFLPLLGWLFALSAFAGDVGIRPSAEALRNWLQWRGPLANGVAPLANPPIHWSETNNVRWKIPLPGKAHSSPIVFGDSVYVLATIPVGEAQKPVYDDAPGVHDSVPVTHRHQSPGWISWQGNICPSGSQGLGLEGSIWKGYCDEKASASRLPPLPSGNVPLSLGNGRTGPLRP